MIRIPCENSSFKGYPYASKVDYVHRHFELTINVPGQRIPIIFGRTRKGSFAYFPSFGEGIMVHRDQPDTLTIDCLASFFDNDTSELVFTAMNQFLRMEEIQEWNKSRAKGAKMGQMDDEDTPF